MDKAAVINTIRNYLSEVRKTIPVDEAIIFGSHVWGKPHQDSDIDVILVSSSFKKMSEYKRLYFLHLRAEKFETVIDPWGFTKEELLAKDPRSTLGDIYLHGWHVT